MQNKEKLIADYAHDYRDITMNEVQLAGFLTQFANEIIEPLIDEIPDGTKPFTIDKDWLIGNAYLKQQLKAKWLRKENND